MLSDGIEALAEALTQIVRTSTEEANRRAYTRHPCSVVTELAGSFGGGEADLLDVSRGGALIHTEVPLGTGDHLMLQFPERDGPQYGHVVGVSRHGIHFQFEPPPLGDNDVVRVAADGRSDLILSIVGRPSGQCFLPLASSRRKPIGGVELLAVPDAIDQR